MFELPIFFAQRVVSDSSKAESDKAEAIKDITNLNGVFKNKGSFSVSNSELGDIEVPYFAGKVRIENSDRIVFCRTRKNYTTDNRFYVHEVFTEDGNKIGETISSTAVTRKNGTLHRGIPLYIDILHGILGNVKNNLGKYCGKRKGRQKV